MVVFTCNNCGDSVSKPKVEKHIQYECKRKHFAVSFCCVDCLQDFNHETVKGHCQCLTEEQRYSAKGFVPKPSSEKGKRKQAGWVDIVQSVIKRTDLDNDERQFLNIIAKFDNVPRKKTKFQNFCFSTAPTYRHKAYLVDKVFDMIEAEFKAQQVQNTPVKSTEISNLQNKNNTENSDKNGVVQKDVKEIKTKKGVEINETIENKIAEEKVEKKKKRSHSKSLEINEVETKPKENIEQQSEKKKKKKENKLLENNTVIEENLEIEDTKLNSDKKTKKLKNKSKVEGSNGIKDNGNTKASNINSIEIGDNEKETQLNSAKKTKKLKNESEKLLLNDVNINSSTKTSNINSIEIGDNEKETQLNSAKKTKKLKNKSDELLLNDVNINSIEIGDNEKETQLNSAKKTKKLKNKSDELLLNDVNINSNIKTSKINSIEYGDNETLNRTVSSLSKKEKKEMKKKMKFQHELATVTNGIIETSKEPISKNKKRKLNDNEENEEPQQKMIKIEKSPQVPEVQNGRKFEWNEAINQVLQSKKNKPTSINKVMKRVMNEYHFLNKTTKKSEKELEKIFLKKLRKIKSVLIDNDKVQLVNC